MRIRTPYLIALSLVATVILLSGCAMRPMGEAGSPGFWFGLLHGLIAPISFVVSLFSHSVRMYAWPNVGRWYDFGFLVGLGVWGGGAAGSSRS